MLLQFSDAGKYLTGPAVPAVSKHWSILNVKVVSSLINSGSLSLKFTSVCVGAAIPYTHSHHGGVCTHAHGGVIPYTHLVCSK